MLNLYFTTSCQDKCKLHFPSEEFKGIIEYWLAWEDVFSQAAQGPTQLQRYLLPEARAAAFFVLKHVAVEMRILGLLTWSKFYDREVAAIESLILPSGNALTSSKFIQKVTCK